MEFVARGPILVRLPFGSAKDSPAFGRFPLGQAAFGPFPSAPQINDGDHGALGPIRRYVNTTRSTWTSSCYEPA
jgi:hypothetical protein